MTRLALFQDQSRTAGGGIRGPAWSTDGDYGRRTLSMVWMIPFGALRFGLTTRESLMNTPPGLRETERESP